MQHKLISKIYIFIAFGIIIGLLLIIAGCLLNGMDMKLAGILLMAAGYAGAMATLNIELHSKKENHDGNQNSLD